MEKLIDKHLVESHINENEREIAIEKLKFVIDNKSKNLISVVPLHNEDEKEIELAILRSFLSRKHSEDLKLALKWNRIDLAKTYIFTGEEEFEPEQLANLMEMALIQNKPEFVELLLENGVDLKSFLKKRRLYYLYNSHIVIYLLKYFTFFTD